MIKSEHEIYTYFLQTTIYSIMVEELYGLRASRIAPILASRELEDPLVFLRNRTRYLSGVAEAVKMYR